LVLVVVLAVVVQKRMDSYTFCTVGGIICKICGRAIRRSHGYYREIAYHEKDNKNHDEPLDDIERLAVVAAFREYVKDMAKGVNAATNNEEVVTYWNRY
jgi:hypothetical protein